MARFALEMWLLEIADEPIFSLSLRVYPIKVLCVSGCLSDILDVFVAKERLHSPKKGDKYQPPSLSCAWQEETMFSKRDVSVVIEPADTFVVI